MVSNLYESKEFYKKQQEGSIAKVYGKDQKLLKDKNGFYLKRTKSNGDEYKQRVGKTDMLYTRSETGVTLYSKEKDYDKKTQRLEENRKDHQAHAHKGDMAKGDKGVYRV